MDSIDAAAAARLDPAMDEITLTVFRSWNELFAMDAHDVEAFQLKAVKQRLEKLAPLVSVLRNQMEEAGVTGDAFRNQERGVIRRVDKAPADGNECQHNSDFHRHDNRVDRGRFRGALDQQQSQDEDDEQRRDVHEAMHAGYRLGFKRRMAPGVRNPAAAQLI